MNEKLLEKKLVKGIKERKGFCLKFIPTYANGFPDRIIIMPGNRVYFVELKTTGKHLGPLQVVWCERLLRMGCVWFLIDDEDKLKSFLNYVK